MNELPYAGMPFIDWDGNTPSKHIKQAARSARPKARRKRKMVQASRRRNRRK
ncbi:MAG: hypothetical protein KAU50_06700 [Candidatus Marinimicrobia bacterium]|nr:hypothetical protein [Candidatus Neomarinimicrobiota bacterium]